MDCGEYVLDDAKTDFKKIVSRIGANDKEEFLTWINSDKISEPRRTEKARVERKLRKIATKLRQIVSFDGSTTTERLDWPVEGKFAECTENTTVHVDQFLYDDEDLDELVEAGHVHRYACRSCGSRDVRPLNIISHSLSIDHLTYLFTQLLPSLGIDLTEKKLVDVGSRLGVVLYAAELSNPKIRSAVGIELNAEFCNIQRATLSEYRLSKASVVCADVRSCEEVFQDADIVTMHNVFGFFLSSENQVQSTKRAL
ncbi:hypothetical protein AAVH_12708 [Aphelenchoides avenae]|nr:hypothetical protein AAVH_12708 [Aphelenchus avenae]